MKTLSTSLSIYIYFYFFIYLYIYVLRKKSHSLTFVFKIPVIFLIINNLTSMTFLEKNAARSIMEVSSYYGRTTKRCIVVRL